MPKYTLFPSPRSVLGLKLYAFLSVEIATVVMYHYIVSVETSMLILSYYMLSVGNAMPFLYRYNMIVATSKVSLYIDFPPFFVREGLSGQGEDAGTARGRVVADENFGFVNGANVVGSQDGTWRTLGEDAAGLEHD